MTPPSAMPAIEDPRTRAWNQTLLARPGELDLHIPAHRVDGSVPLGLRGGRFLSNGPGWTQFGDLVAHPFDGHGYVRSFAFEADGSVRFRARFVNTAVYRSELETGTFRHRGFATDVPGGMLRNLPPQQPRNVANTTIVPWGGQLLAGWEGGAPHALDRGSLETVGEETFGGALEGQTTLAHLHPDPTVDRLVCCSLKNGRNTGLVFREIDPSGEVVQTRTGEIPGIAFAHDFAFSERFYVLGGNPLGIDAWAFVKSQLGSGSLLGAIRFRDDAPGTLVLVPRREQGPTRVIRLPRPAMVVHFVNAYDTADGDLVVDAAVFHRFPFGQEFGYSGPHAPLDPSLPDVRGPQRLYRITIRAGSDDATWTELTEHGVDFPRVALHARGANAAMMVGACRADPRFSDPFDSILRIDLHDPEAPEVLWTAPEDVFVGEPVVATDGDGAPDHVVCIAYDGLRQRSTLAVFAADDLSAGPVAAVPLPLLPMGFHGEVEAPPS